MEPGPTTETSDEPFTDKIRKVRDVLVSGEGFVDAEVEYAPDARMIFFRAPGASSFKMRREEFDRRTDCEIAFYVSTKMRPLVASPRRTAPR